MSKLLIILGVLMIPVSLRSQLPTLKLGQQVVVSGHTYLLDVKEVAGQIGLGHGPKQNTVTIYENGIQIGKPVTTYTVSEASAEYIVRQALIDSGKMTPELMAEFDKLQAKRDANEAPKYFVRGNVLVIPSSAGSGITQIMVDGKIVWNK